MTNGVKTTDLPPLSNVEDVIGNHEGTTGRIALAILRGILAQAMILDGPIADELATIRGQVTGGLLAPATWADLQLLTGSEDNAGAEVPQSDAGTHAQATATGYDGASVNNSGRYRWVSAWSRWERIADVAGSGWAALSHGHAMSEIVGLVDALAAKAASSHAHAIGDVSGLQLTLDALDLALDGKAGIATVHGDVSAPANGEFYSETHNGDPAARADLTLGEVRDGGVRVIRGSEIPGDPGYVRIIPKMAVQARPGELWEFEFEVARLVDAQVPPGADQPAIALRLRNLTGAYANFSTVLGQTITPDVSDGAQVLRMTVSLDDPEADRVPTSTFFAPELWLYSADDAQEIEISHFRARDITGQISPSERATLLAAPTPADLAAKADLVSPALSGAPTAPTAAQGTQTEQIATTSFVAQALADIATTAPEVLQALQDVSVLLDANGGEIAALYAQIAQKQDADIGAEFAITWQQRSEIEIDRDAATVTFPPMRCWRGATETVVPGAGVSTTLALSSGNTPVFYYARLAAPLAIVATTDFTAARSQPDVMLLAVDALDTFVPLCFAPHVETNAHKRYASRIVALDDPVHKSVFVNDVAETKTVYFGSMRSYGGPDGDPSATFDPVTLPLDVNNNPTYYYGLKADGSVHATTSFSNASDTLDRVFFGSSEDGALTLRTGIPITYKSLEDRRKRARRAGVTYRQDMFRRAEASFSDRPFGHGTLTFPSGQRCIIAPPVSGLTYNFGGNAVADLTHMQLGTTVVLTGTNQFHIYAGLGRTFDNSSDGYLSLSNGGTVVVSMRLGGPSIVSISDGAGAVFSVFADYIPSRHLATWGQSHGVQLFNYGLGGLATALYTGGTVFAHDIGVTDVAEGGTGVAFAGANDPWWDMSTYFVDGGAPSALLLAKYAILQAKVSASWPKVSEFWWDCGDADRSCFDPSSSAPQLTVAQLADVYGRVWDDMLSQTALVESDAKIYVTMYGAGRLFDGNTANTSATAANAVRQATILAATDPARASQIVIVEGKAHRARDPHDVHHSPIGLHYNGVVWGNAILRERSAATFEDLTINTVKFGPQGAYVDVEMSVPTGFEMIDPGPVGTVLEAIDDYQPLNWVFHSVGGDLVNDEIPVDRLEVLGANTYRVYFEPGGDGRNASIMTHGGRMDDAQYWRGLYCTDTRQGPGGLTQLPEIYGPISTAV